MKKISFIYLFLFPLLFLHVATTQSPVFSVHPVSTAGVDGSTVEFTCTANNTDGILYRVNGTTASESAVISKGFNQLAQSTVDGVTTRVLSVAVSSLYNNTEILCRAIGEDNVDSNTAILTVQDPLAAVDDLSYSFTDSSTVNISWSPPFTLPGTDITGYNISATSNGTTTNYFTSKNDYELMLTDITDSPCNEIIITVSGYNGLDGEIYSLTGIYLPSTTIDSPLPVSVSISSERQLSAVFNISDLCNGQYPDNGIFFLFTDGSLVNSTENMLGDDFTTDNILRVSMDTNYTLEASLSNLAGTFDINSTTTFNTLSIESVAITDTTDGRVCVECVFASFSTDSVCTVELVSNNTGQEYNETFSRSSTDSTAVASGCISDVIPGVYTVRVLNGRGKAVDISLLPSDITVTDIVVTTTIPTATTRTSTEPSNVLDSSPSDIPTDKNDGGIVVVGIVGGVVAAVVACMVVILASNFIIFAIWRKSKRKGSADLNHSGEKSCHDSPFRTSKYNDRHPPVNHRNSTDSTKLLIYSTKGSIIKDSTYETILEKVKADNEERLDTDLVVDECHIRAPPPDGIYSTVVSVEEQEKSTSSDKTNCTINQSQYVQLNLNNQPIPTLPLQSVDYIEVDHNRTSAAKQQQNDTANNTSLVTGSHDHTPSSSPSPPPIPTRNSPAFPH